MRALRTALATLKAEGNINTPELIEVALKSALERLPESERAAVIADVIAHQNSTWDEQDARNAESREQAA